uniref:Uncharacterized protein n=1 Tax=Anguilla anguilla TaxID=7936 RepID=A0A0E9VBW5_ANGAN
MFLTHVFIFLHPMMACFTGMDSSLVFMLRDNRNGIQIGIPHR